MYAAIRDLSIAEYWCPALTLFPATLQWRPVALVIGAFSKAPTNRESGETPERPRRCNERKGRLNLKPLSASLCEADEKAGRPAPSQKTYQSRFL